MDTLKNMLTPVGVLPDTLKLVVLGGSAEAVRRVSYSAWSGFVDSFFLTAHFNEGDDPYEWLMCWLNTQPGWERSRELDVAGRPDGRKNAGNKEEDHLNAVAFQPSMGTMNTLYYRGHWLRITRAKDNPSRRYSRSSLKISVVARNNDIIKKLVLEAKRLHQREAENRVNIYVPEVEDESWVDWEHSDSRKIRPMSSIVLPPEVKDSLIADCFDFLSSEAWYAERGIPFRRGYLLHGVPGSGKTSLINALAGALNLDIYVLSLSGKEMSDTILLKLLSCAPPRCIMLLEDLDAAFTQSTMREQKEKEKDEDEDEDDSNGNVSLAGLLNALDGVGASEGRLLFATTNHIERLDPALKRPGRMDVQVHFGWATRWQAEGMFKRFFEGKNCVLSVDEMGPLAKRFADAIPEDELSVAALQGYLLKNKTRPKECVEEFGVWIVEERERQKLRKAEMERKAKEDEEKKKLKKEEDAKKKEAEAEEKKKEEEEKKKAVDSDADSDSEAE